MTERAWRVARHGLALLACLLVPAWSWLDGSGSLAWSMYAHSSSFRLSVSVVNQRGVTQAIAPSSLAAVAERDVQTALGGSEAFRHARQGNVLKRYLPQIAQLACQVKAARSVVVTLEQKRSLDAPVVSDVARLTCAAAGIAR